MSTHDKPDELKALLEEFGNAHFDCGDWVEGSDSPAYEAVRVKADEAEAKLISYINGARSADRPTDHRATGESAGAQASGMECGRAAPQVPESASLGGRSVSGQRTPAAAASLSSVAPSEPMPRTFEYLLNAMEHAAQADKPSSLAYGAKRRAVFQHVQDLWDDYIRLLREKQDRLNAAPSATEPDIKLPDAVEHIVAIGEDMLRKEVMVGFTSQQQASAFYAWLKDFFDQRFEKMSRTEGATKNG